MMFINKSKTTEEYKALLEKHKISLPINHLMIKAPIIKERTPAGIFKVTDGAYSEEERHALIYTKWHEILLSTAPSIKIGDSVMVKQGIFQGYEIIIEGELFVSFEPYMISAQSEGGVANDVAPEIKDDVVDQKAETHV